MKFRALIALATLMALIGTVSPALAGYNDNRLPQNQQQYQWSTPPKSRPYVHIDGAWGAAVFPTGLVGDKALMPYVVEQKDGHLIFCTTVDADCINNSDFGANGFFNLCSEDSRIACLDSIEYQKPDGSWAKAEITEQVDETPDQSLLSSFITSMSRSSTPPLSVVGKLGWPAVESIGLPSSAKGPLVVSMPGIPNAAGQDSYVVNASYSYNKTAHRVLDFSLSIRPVSIDKTRSNSMYRWVSVLNGEEKVSGTASGQVDFNDESIAESSTKEIGWAAAFKTRTAMRVNLRLPNTLGGWFQTRLDQPDVAVKAFDSTTNQVTLAGAPTTVPITEGAIAMNDPSNKDDVGKLFGPNTWDNSQKVLANGGNPGLMTWTTWYPSSGISLFDNWRKYIPDKALGTADVWSAGHIYADDRCMNDRSSLQGLVNTSALVFQPSVPTFENGFLTYKVAGVHYDSSGDVYRGTYDFIMKKTVAECLYGFTDAPIYGSVSVTSSDGAEQVATTSVSEQDGWLKLSAKGFTFSDPVIKATLTQPTAPKVVPQSPAKLVKILCARGKSIKSVEATNPKCPAGYTLKK
jgi:hypothetical protein